VSEKQLRAAFDVAVKASAGKTGETLVSQLERRLDAVVLRAGFARTVYQVRQLVYLRASMPDLTATLVADPDRSDVPVICNEQLVVEYYSR
jgi:small subunit ribosomal protein S4